MNVSIIIPTQGFEASLLSATLRGVSELHYDAGMIEVLVVQYGDGDALTLPSMRAGRQAILISANGPSPYKARNLAASRATGDVLLFTEPGCVPVMEWVQAHIARLREPAATVSVGRVTGAHVPRLAEILVSYEDVRDAWVFSCGRWQYYFGRPKNMAIARTRFATHGPFAEVIRGADSTFVQRVARELSCGEIRLTHDAVVRQTSIRGLASLLRDRFNHARALRVHRSSHAAPISLEQRVYLFRETMRRNRYSKIEAGVMLALLCAGILAFKLGGAAGSLAIDTGPRRVRN